MKKNMLIKKIAIYFLIISIVIISGCGQKSAEKPKEDSSFDIKVASNVIDVYMNSLMKEDVEGTKRLFSKELLEKTKDIKDGELKVKGYNVEETNEIGKSGFFKLKVSRINLNKPLADLDECTIKVIKEGSEYKISEIKNQTEKEAFYQEGIRIRSKTNIKTNLVLDEDSIPQYAFSKDDKANLYKLPVPRSKFGVMDFGYGGERLVITTYLKDTFIGIVKIDESLAVQGSNGNGGGDSGGGSTKGGAGGDTSGSKAREKPIGKEITTVDMLKDSKVDFMTFSQDEKFLVVQYTKQGGGKCIRLYTSDNGDLAKIKFDEEGKIEMFEERYAVDKVDIVFSSFDKDVLNFEVIAKNNSDKSVSDSTGKWQIDLKSFKVKKL